MKINWRVLIALVVVFGAIYLAVDSTRARSYAGSNLNFAVGSGPVTVTNPSDESIPVQLVGPRSSSFSVTSDTEGISGSSTRQGSGTNTAHLYEFDLPTGVSEFTLVRGTNVNFVANTEFKLEATVQPLRESDVRTTLIVLAVVVLGSLFYISHTTKHTWIKRIRGVDTSIPQTPPAAASTAGGQGRTIRSVGDNRANIKD